MEMIPEGEPHHVTHQNKGNFISFLIIWSDLS